MAYTQAQIIAALKKSQRRWSFQYKLYDLFGNYKQDLRLSSCSIQNNDLADVKRTVTLSMREDDASQVSFATDRIQPIVKLLMPDGNYMAWNMGLFLMSSPTQIHAGRTVPDRAVTGYDLGQVLRDDEVTDRYTVLAGTRYVDAIQQLLISASLPPAQIAGSASTLPGDLDWDAGTSKYVIINALLAAMNYASLSFDGQGQPYAGPYLAPDVAPLVYPYVVGKDGVIIPDDGIQESLDLSGVPNVFVCYVSTPDVDAAGNAIALRSQYINSNPQSPTSTVSLNRRIVQYLELTDIADQISLDAATQTQAVQASQVYSQVEFKSGLMPFHTTADVMTLDWGDGPIRYRETQWSFDCKAGAPMSHQARRVVSV